MKSLRFAFVKISPEKEAILSVMFHVSVLLTKKQISSSDCTWQVLETWEEERPVSLQDYSSFMDTATLFS